MKKVPGSRSSPDRPRELSKAKVKFIGIHPSNARLNMRSQETCALKSGYMKRASSTDLPFEILPPDDTPEYMYPAYFSCFMWAIKFPPILQQFTTDTGIDIPNPRSPIYQMVDKATGFDPYDGFVRAFTPWFNDNVWGGIDDMPDGENN